MPEDRSPFDAATEAIIRRRAAAAKRVGVGLAALVMALAMVLLVGWYTRTPVFMTWGGLVATKANVGASALLQGAAIVAFAVGRRRLAALLVVVPLAYGIVAFVQRVSGVSLGVDEVLVSDFTVAGTAQIGGRPALETIALVVSTSAALLVLALSPRSIVAVTRLVICLEIIVLLSFVQQLGGGSTLFPVTESPGVAYPTTGLYALLAASIQCVIADRGGQVFHTWVDTSLRARVLLAMTFPLLAAAAIPAIGIIVEVKHGERSDAILLARLWGLSMVVLVTLFWVFTKMLSGSVVSRLDRLVANAESIRRGDFEAPIDLSGNDEISRLTRHFDTMREALRDRRGQDELRRRVAQSVGRAEDLPAAFAAFGDAAYQRFRWDRASYMVPVGDEALIMATHGPPESRDAVNAGPLRPAALVEAETFAAAPEPVLIDELRAPFSDAYAPVKSLMYAPIVVTGEVKAAVVASAYETGRFTEDDLELFSSLVAEVAGTFQHLHLLEREKEAVRRLTILDELRSEFIAMVAHDLRLPMSVISNTIEMLRSDWNTLSDNEREAYLRRLSDRMKGTSRFVDDMLRVVRIESGDAAPAAKPFDLAAVVRAVVNDFVHHQSPRPFHIDVDDDLPLVLGDERAQWQVLNNLLANACKYSEEDRPVQVSAHRNDGMVVVSVSDRGPGIAEEDREAVFEKFSRAVQGSATLKVAGSGLGLYICRRLVEADGGRIWVDSTPGEGSSFRYTVPVAGGA